MLGYRHSARTWHCHVPGGGLPLLSARPEVTVPATEHHGPLASTKLYMLVTEARVCVNNLPRVVSCSGPAGSLCFHEHLYSPKQAARQTEDRLYTHGKEVHTTVKAQKMHKN